MCAVVVSQDTAVCGRVVAHGKWPILRCLCRCSGCGPAGGHARSGQVVAVAAVVRPEK